MGVTKTVIEEGDGKNFPVKGDKLKMHYTGTLADGTKFDRSMMHDCDVLTLRAC